jgi:hypothetical protein
MARHATSLFLRGFSLLDSAPAYRAYPALRNSLASHAQRSCSSGLLAPPPPVTIKDVRIVNGLPQITLPLPSRNEMCVFSLKPGDFFNEIFWVNHNNNYWYR